jgi:hypothetical protein
VRSQLQNREKIINRLLNIFVCVESLRSLEIVKWFDYAWDCLIVSVLFARWNRSVAFAEQEVICASYFFCAISGFVLRKVKFKLFLLESKVSSLICFRIRKAINRFFLTLESTR